MSSTYVHYGLAIVHCSQCCSCSKQGPRAHRMLDMQLPAGNQQNTLQNTKWSNAGRVSSTYRQQMLQVQSMCL